MVESKKPVLLLHKTHQRHKRLREVAEVLQAEVGDEVTIGVALSLPNQRPKNAQRFLDGLSLDLRVIDPTIYACPSQLGTTCKTPSRLFPYMREPWPARPDRRLIHELFQQQRGLGATVLLSPTGLIEASDPERELTTAFDWIREARDLEPAAEMMVNLTLDRSWLRTASLREHLLEEMVDSPETGWYLRVRWAAIKPPYSQQRDDDLLKGYQQLGQVARDEGKTLIYPTSGLTGWLASGLGASGFGSGTDASAQAFAEAIDVRLPKGRRRPRIERYFEPALLGIVDLATHRTLLGQHEYITCDCPFCEELDASNPNLDPSGWNGETASLHCLVQLGRLLSKLQGGDPQVEARKEVERARDFYNAVTNSVPGSVAGNNRPLHLRAWGQVLQ